MPPAPYSPDEASRLAAVKRLRLLGTPAEERFDVITRMARSQFDVPLACLDIVGEKLAWLKSVQGFDGIMGLRKDSYCHYTVLNDGVCVVRDARSDPRVHDSDFADSWVFYAGVPLHFDGQRVGVLCIGDDKSRDFSASQFNRLMSLASLAEREFQTSVLSPAQTTLPAADDELEMQGRIDVLTHLWNRPAIVELAKSECGHAAGDYPIAIAMVGIDDLGQIREDLGSATADQVLRVVAERLRAALPPSDAAGRYEDEAFLAVLPNAGPREAALICERIRASVAATAVQFGRTTVPVTCSIGYAVSSGFGPDDAAGLAARAGQALQRANEAGRNRVAYD